MKATEVTEARRRRRCICPPAANYSETREKGGPFALPGGGRDRNMNAAGGKEDASEDESLNVWHKYWMNVNKECRGRCQKRRSRGASVSHVGK